jgi:hypothetical protein
MRRWIIPAAPYFYSTLDSLDSIKKRSWACHSMSARGLAHGKHLNHITSCKYSLSLGLFVSSYPLPFDTFLSIRGHFYHVNGRAGGLYCGLFAAPPLSPQAKWCWQLLLDMPDWGRNTRLSGWIMARRHTTPALYTTRKRLALLVVQRGLQLYTTYLLPSASPAVCAAGIHTAISKRLSCMSLVHTCMHPCLCPSASRPIRDCPLPDLRPDPSPPSPLPACLHRSDVSMILALHSHHHRA